MGEVRDDEEDDRAAWESMIAAASGGFRHMADRLLDAGPPPSGPSPVLVSPLIVDTDIGGDPDDAIALAVAALHVPELALVITSDEHEGERARLARYLLDLAGRPDVPVVAGADLGGTRYYCAGHLVPAGVPAQPADVAAAAGPLLDASNGPVRWLGIGPMTNLAALLAGSPQYAGQLHVTQMGGALAYRDPTRAEHNVRRDPASAIALITTLPHLTLIPSDVTFTTATEITASSPIAQALADPQAPPWAALLTAHLHSWFKRFHPGTMQHDSLALAAALGHPALDYAATPVTIAPDGRMAASADGIPLTMASRVRYEGFMWWLARQLDWRSATAEPPGAAATQEG
jgi:pyrimidine-specific ribonucleoside hydrolase